MAAMGLNKKPGPARPQMASAYDYPEELVPPLPSSVIERFSELEAWQKATAANYKTLVDVLLRRDREVSGAIEEIKAALP